MGFGFRVGFWAPVLVCHNVIRTDYYRIGSTSVLRTTKLPKLVAPNEEGPDRLHWVSKGCLPGFSPGDFGLCGVSRSLLVCTLQYTQRVHIHYRCGTRSPKPRRDGLSVPNSIMVVFVDPLG